jgi:hypothetical protein
MFHISINGIRFSAETVEEVTAMVRAFQSTEVIDANLKPNEHMSEQPLNRRVHRRVIHRIVEASDETAEITSRALRNATEAIHHQGEIVAGVALDQVWNLAERLGAQLIEGIQAAMQAAERRKRRRDPRNDSIEPPIPN